MTTLDLERFAELVELANLRPCDVRDLDATQTYQLSTILSQLRIKAQGANEILASVHAERNPKTPPMPDKALEIIGVVHREILATLEAEADQIDAAIAPQVQRAAAIRQVLAIVDTDFVEALQVLTNSLQLDALIGAAGELRTTDDDKPDDETASP